MKPVMMTVPLIWTCLAAQIQFSPGQRMQIPQQDQTGKASIEGSVTDTMTHEPVKKAQVSLNGRMNLNAVTDASGHFAFRQLPAGQYMIRAYSDKYPNSQFSFDSSQQLSISLAADEQKQDVAVSLTPGGSVGGHIVDEDGNPMSSCNVTAMQLRDTGMGRNLRQGGSSQSDDKGEYRISNLLAGKYYIQARCFKSIPLPHAFIRRSNTADVPTLAYTAVFYPSADDPSGASKVQVSPGAEVSGIDFRMAPARGITIRGHVGPSTGSNIQLSLEPKESLTRQWRRQTARLNPSTGEFQIPNVRPGSYDLVATTWGEGPVYFAKSSVEVGDAPLDPIDLTLAAAPSISGSISIDGDSKAPMNSFHIMMNQLDGRAMTGPPQAQAQSDGTFALSSVMPGHWRLNVNGAPGYIKSVRQGDQEVSPWDFEIGTSPTQLKVVIGTKLAQVVASPAVASPGSEPISAVLLPASGDPQFMQIITFSSQGPTRVSIPPGKYYACAFGTAQPWPLMQSLALRKALQDRSAAVEATTEADASVQVPLITASDLKQLLEKIEE